ncbi:flavin reductase family protein [Streptomyces sp. NPDC006670]|uniref:flavin reductase family protein n=1 Tax=Streptomyces sp. NPDC006670 TaxID=3154476 RepID=UPI003400EC2A
MPTEELTDSFRHAMSSFPSGVTIVTTADAEGNRWGFTATSFCSVSLDPPMVLVCLSADAQCHPAFSAASSWVVHVLPPEHRDLALWFASKGVDKFSRGAYTTTPQGHPLLDGATATLECDTTARHRAGDHTVLIGTVTRTRVHPATPLVYHHRAFHTLTPLPTPAPVS